MNVALPFRSAGCFAMVAASSEAVTTRTCGAAAVAGAALRCCAQMETAKRLINPVAAMIRMKPPDSFRVVLCQSLSKQHQQAGPGSLRLILVVCRGIQRTPAVHGRIDLDLRG